MSSPWCTNSQRRTAHYCAWTHGLQVGKEGNGSRGLPGARSWVPGRGLSCRLLCLLLAGGVWVVQSPDGYHLFTSLSTFGPPAPPELSPVTGLNRCLVAVLQPKTGVPKGKGSSGGRTLSRQCEPSPLLAGWLCSRPSTNSHCCTPTPRLGFLPFNVPAIPRPGWAVLSPACRHGSPCSQLAGQPTLQGNERAQGGATALLAPPRTQDLREGRGFGH